MSTEIETETPKEPTIGEELQQLLKEVRSLSRKLSLAKNGLKNLARKEPESADLQAWIEAESLLHKEIGIPSIDEKAHSLASRLTPLLKKLRMKARMSFLTKLEILAGQKELTVERVSEAPLVLFIKPLTFEVDFDGGGVKVLYGHEFIEDLPIDAAILLNARERILAESRKKLLPAEKFFPLLHQAYKMVLASENLEYGERVDVVDIVVPLALLLAGSKDLRKKGIAALDAYPRYLLAMQLAKQRRDGVLEDGGFRLDLGAATGGSTRNKDDVLFIPVGASSGQYYRSLRFERLS